MYSDTANKLLFLKRMYKWTHSYVNFHMNWQHSRRKGNILLNSPEIVMHFMKIVFSFYTNQKKLVNTHWHSFACDIYASVNLSDSNRWTKKGQKIVSFLSTFILKISSRWFICSFRKNTFSVNENSNTILSVFKMYSIFFFYYSYSGY